MLHRAQRTPRGRGYFAFRSRLSPCPCRPCAHVCVLVCVQSSLCAADCVQHCVKLTTATGRAVGTVERKVKMKVGADKASRSRATL